METSTGWHEEIAAAYQEGLEDARNGKEARTDLDFQGAYDQGYSHGRKEVS